MVVIIGQLLLLLMAKAADRKVARAPLPQVSQVAKFGSFGAPSMGSLVALQVDVQLVPLVKAATHSFAA